MKALLTRKIGMTRVLDEDGAAIAVTLLSAKPNDITQIKTTENDGYNAVQVSLENKKKVAREFRINDDELGDLRIGAKISADSFGVGDVVSVTGISKGKGFAGTIKRHRFHRGRKTHGRGSYRRPGSIGSMYPQKIFKGKKMAGHMGHERVTTKNLRIRLIDNDLGVIGVGGAVPGPRKGLVVVRGVEK